MINRRQVEPDVDITLALLVTNIINGGSNVSLK